MPCQVRPRGCHLLRALTNTLVVGGLAAGFTVIGAIFMVYGVFLSGAAWPRLCLPLTTIGYAVPGAVLAVGTLVPLAALDHHLADLIEAATGHDPGLLLTGTAAALVFAYSVRFLPSHRVRLTARSAGWRRRCRWRPVRLGGPKRGTLTSGLSAADERLCRNSVASGVCRLRQEELPATLLLRPFNFDTLATRVHEGQPGKCRGLSGCAPGDCCRSRSRHASCQKQPLKRLDQRNSGPNLLARPKARQYLPASAYPAAGRASDL